MQLVPGGGHQVMAEQAAAVNAALDTFVATTLAAAAAK